jgi:hypothetical protein
VTATAAYQDRFPLRSALSSSREICSTETRHRSS